MDLADGRKDELLRAPAFEHREGAVVPHHKWLSALHSPTEQVHICTFLHQFLQLNLCCNSCVSMTPMLGMSVSRSTAVFRLNCSILIKSRIDLHRADNTSRKSSVHCALPTRACTTMPTTMIACGLPAASRLSDSRFANPHTELRRTDNTSRKSFVHRAPDIVDLSRRDDNAGDIRLEMPAASSLNWLEVFESFIDLHRAHNTFRKSSVRRALPTINRKHTKPPPQWLFSPRTKE